MRIKMTNRAFNGVANVLPDKRKTWEAAGWVAVPQPSKKISSKKETEQ